MLGNGRMKNGSISPRSPLVRLDSNTAQEEDAVEGFLSRLQRNEIDDQS